MTFSFAEWRNVVVPSKSIYKIGWRWLFDCFENHDIALRRTISIKMTDRGSTEIPFWLFKPLYVRFVGKICIEQSKTVTRLKITETHCIEFLFLFEITRNSTFVLVFFLFDRSFVGLIQRTEIHNLPMYLSICLHTDFVFFSIVQLEEWLRLNFNLLFNQGHNLRVLGRDSRSIQMHR